MNLLKSRALLDGFSFLHIHKSLQQLLGHVLRLGRKQIRLRFLFALISVDDFDFGKVRDWDFSRGRFDVCVFG